MKKMFLLALVFFLSASFACAENVTETVSESSQIDWTNGVVMAKGLGYPSDYSTGTPAQKKLEARQAAKADAIRKLAEAVNSIRVDGKTTVKDFAAQDDVVRTHVEGFVKNCVEKEVVYKDDGGCETVVVASLNGKGALSDIILNSVETRVTDLSGVSNAGEKKEDLAKEETPAVKEEVEPAKTEQPAETAVPEGAEQAKADTAEETASASGTKTGTAEEAKPEVTTETAEADAGAKAEQVVEKPSTSQGKISRVSGLIINAVKTNARPAINPSIVSDTGEKLYGLNVADRSFRTRQGLASYTVNVENAEVNDRVTKTPYVIEAKGTSGDNPCVIVIDKKDFEEFMKTRGSDIALSHCRVIIVVSK